MATRRVRDIVLVVSLAFNTLMIGLVIGAGAAGLGTPGAPGAMRLAAQRDAQITPRRLVDALPEDYRREARRILRREGVRALPLIVERGRARRAALAALLADDFDDERVASALARLRAAEAAVTERGHEILVMILDEMPPEERGALVREVRERAAAEAPAGGGALAERMRARWRDRVLDGALEEAEGEAGPSAIEAAPPPVEGEADDDPPT